MLKFNWTEQREMGEITSRDQRERNPRRKTPKERDLSKGVRGGEREREGVGVGEGAK
jgi:hypothetical protein